MFERAIKDGLAEDVATAPGARLMIVLELESVEVVDLDEVDDLQNLEEHRELISRFRWVAMHNDA